MADRAREWLSLAELWLLPAWRPPHKAQTSLSPYPQRLAMTRLLAAERPWLRVSEAEREMGGTGYSVDLVEFIRRGDGAGRELLFLIGGDSLRDMDGWKDPDRLFAAIEVAVFARENCEAAVDRPCRIYDESLHPASSTLIRAAIAAGEKAEWLTAPVAEFVAREGLYRRERAQ